MSSSLGANRGALPDGRPVAWLRLSLELPSDCLVEAKPLAIGRDGAQHSPVVDGLCGLVRRAPAGRDPLHELGELYPGFRVAEAAERMSYQVMGPKDLDIRLVRQRSDLYWSTGIKAKPRGEALRLRKR